MHSHLLCNVVNNLVHVPCCARRSLSGEDRALRNESPMCCSPLLRLADSAPLFIRRSLSPAILGVSLSSFCCSQTGMLLAIGVRFPFPSTLLILKPLDLTSALAGAPGRREQRCALLYAARVPSSQITSIAAEVACERRRLKVKGGGGTTVALLRVSSNCPFGRAEG